MEAKEKKKDSECIGGNNQSRSDVSAGVLERVEVDLAREPMSSYISLMMMT